MIRQLLARVGWSVLLLVVLSLVVGHVLGQPILLGYVTSASMEPTIEEGEGFVAVPAQLSGDVQEGDVIVFQARELHGGGLTTHRVVDVTEDGYVTKGDGNPFTDQDGPEPPVRDQQVVAEALQIGGTVVAIPYVGDGAQAIVGTADAVRVGLQSVLGLEVLSDERGYGFVLVGGGLLLLGLAALGGGRRVRSRERRPDQRPVLNATAAVLGVSLLVATMATTAMVVPAGVQEFGVAAESQPTDDPLVVEPGGTATVSYEVTNAGPVPTVAILEPGDESIRVEPRRTTVGGWSSTEVEATIAVPEEEGLHYRTVGEHRYFAVLPPRVLVALHGVHPVLAVAAVDATIAALVAIAGFALLGRGDVRVRSGRSLPFGAQIRRYLSGWF